MIFNQSEYNIRCEWGEKGIVELVHISDVIIIVDVLSFSTSVEIATSQGAVVYPCQWKDKTVYDFADSIGAEVALRGSSSGYTICPSSLLELPPRIRLILPSPNGSALSLLTDGTPTLVGCLRNCQAVAESAMKMGRNIAIIPAGERWEDGTLRPCFEDFVGAGAIIRFIHGSLSPEARITAAAFEGVSSNVLEALRGCSSGKEKLTRGEERDLELAAALNVSTCTPLLRFGAYEQEL